jgi:hypothetical protein
MAYDFIEPEEDGAGDPAEQLAEDTLDPEELPLDDEDEPLAGGD